MLAGCKRWQTHRNTHTNLTLGSSPECMQPTFSMPAKYVAGQQPMWINSPGSSASTSDNSSASSPVLPTTRSRSRIAGTSEVVGAEAGPAHADPNFKGCELDEITELHRNASVAEKNLAALPGAGGKSTRSRDDSAEVDIGAASLGSHLDHVSVPDEAQVAPRKRMRFKQPPQVCPDKLACNQTIAYEEGQKLRDAKMHARRLFAQQAAKLRAPGVTYKDARYAGYKQFADLPQAEQSSWVDKAFNYMGGRHEQAAALAIKRDEKIQQNEEFDYDMKAHGALLTFNGDWMQIELADVVNEHRHDVPALEACVMSMRVVNDFFDEFWATMEAAGKEQGWIAVSCALELSLSSADAGRVHLHCMASFPILRSRAGCMFRRTMFRSKRAGHVQPCVCRKGPGGRDRALREGHYYVQAAKIGHILHRSSYQAFLEFRVEARFIMNLYRSRKMSSFNTKLELCKSRDRVAANVASS
jgi:hypothetical protein